MIPYMYDEYAPNIPNPWWEYIMYPDDPPIITKVWYNRYGVDDGVHIPEYRPFRMMPNQPPLSVMDGVVIPAPAINPGSIKYGSDSNDWILIGSFVLLVIGFNLVLSHRKKIISKLKSIGKKKTEKYGSSYDIKKGDTVKHPKFGKGVVKRVDHTYTAPMIIVAFDDYDEDIIRPISEIKKTEKYGAEKRSPKSGVLHDAINISSGTLGTLTGKSSYKELDEIQEQWVDWLKTDPENYDTWQDAWNDFWPECYKRELKQKYSAGSPVEKLQKRLSKVISESGIDAGSWGVSVDNGIDVGGLATKADADKLSGIINTELKRNTRSEEHPGYGWLVVEYDNDNTQKYEAPKNKIKQFKDPLTLSPDKDPYFPATLHEIEVRWGRAGGPVTGRDIYRGKANIHLTGDPDMLDRYEKALKKIDYITLRREDDEFLIVSVPVKHPANDIKIDEEENLYSALDHTEDVDVSKPLTPAGIKRLGKEFVEQLENIKDEPLVDRWGKLKYWDGLLDGLVDAKIITYRDRVKIYDLSGKLPQFKNVYKEIHPETSHRFSAEKPDVNNGIRDMFYSKQYKGIVPDKDIQHILTSARWDKFYGKGVAKKAWSELVEDEYVEKKGDSWHWFGYESYGAGDDTVYTEDYKGYTLNITKDDNTWPYQVVILKPDGSKLGSTMQIKDLASAKSQLPEIKKQLDKETINVDDTIGGIVKFAKDHGATFTVSNGKDYNKYGILKYKGHDMEFSKDQVMRNGFKILIKRLDEVVSLADSMYKGREKSGDIFYSNVSLHVNQKFGKSKANDLAFSAVVDILRDKGLNVHS